MKRFLLHRKGVFALILALCLGMGTAYAADFSATCSTGQTLYYNIIDVSQHYVELTFPGENDWAPWEGYTKPTGNITLPSSVTYNGVNYTVIAIGDYAFYECSGLTGTLTIPSSVTTIGDNTFCECTGFTGSLIIPNSVTTIGFQAFATCSGFNGSLSIPNSVTTIGRGAFGWCPNFTGSLTIPNSVTVIEGSAFYLDSGFTGTLTIPNSVTSIGESAFSSCGFTGLILGNSLTTIGEHAFHTCQGFTGPLTIPNSVTTIGSHAFYACDGFTSLTLGNSITTIGSWAFHSCDGLKGSLTIPNSVTTIGNSAFAWCFGFNGTLTIGTGVTSMGTGVFDNDSGFTQVKYNAINCEDVTEDAKPFVGCGGTLAIGNSVQRIPSYMFASGGFTGLLTISNSVTTIGQAAFAHCNGFTSIMVFPETPPILGESVFMDLSTDIPVKVPCNKLNTYQNASGWNAFTNMQDYCDPLTYSINPDGVSVTVTGHQDGTNATGELYIPETKTINGVTYTVTAIGNNAFNNCSGLTGSLTIPNTVTAIGDHAFYYCSGLTGSLTIPNTVTSIDAYAFDGCSGFTGSLTLGNSLTTLGRYCFADCSGFTGNLVIPNSVTFIDEGAFAWSGGFDGMLTLGNNLTTIGNYAFYYLTCNGTLTIPNSVTSIGLAAFGFCNGFTSLSLGNSLATIGGWAFTGCTNLTGTLTIPSSVTSIGQSAFQNDRGFTQVNYNAVDCANLSASAKPFEGCTATTLNIGYTVQRIPNYLFFECSNFTGSLTIPNSVIEIGIGAFRNCTGFTGSLTLGNSLVSLGIDAFTNCNFTGSLTIPNSVTTLGMYAFWCCRDFTGTLTIGNGVTSIGKNAFGNCNGFTQINYNAINCADVAEDTKPFEGCTAATSLNIGSNVKRIPAYMFFQCSNFTGSLSIPDAVTSIGDYAFCECGGLNGSLSLGNSLTAIGDFAFYANHFHGSLTIPNSVTTLDSYAFAWCQYLDGSLTIGNSLGTISNSAFYYCKEFSSLTIGNAVTSIGNMAFDNCTGLTSMTVLPETPPTLGADVFNEVTTNIPVYVPCGSISDYQTASGWSDFTNFQCMPWTVTLTANPLGYGDVTGEGTYNNGASCTVTATPYSNYQFMHWSKNGEVVSCNASYTFNVYEDTDLEAVFLAASNLGTIVGTGTGSNQYLPSHSYYRYGLTEQIYRTGELGGSTTITSISFFNEGATKTRTYDIYLMHTTRVNFSSATDWIPVSSSYKVYSGTVTMREGLWTTIELDTPFSYNGSNNLLLVVDDNTGSFTSSPHMQCRVFDATNDFHEPSNQTLHIVSDYTNYDPSDPSFYTGTLMTVKNQIMFNRQAYTITATSSNPTAGTVSGAGVYGVGDMCRLKATANSGYTFMGWTDEEGVLVSSEAEYEFKVTGNRTLVAYFLSGYDICNLTFNLHDAYGDGWNGNYLVVDNGSGIIQQLAVPSSQYEATYILPFENGSHIELSWIMGSWTYECSFEISYSNGNMVCVSAGQVLDSGFEFDIDMDCDEMPASWVYLGDEDNASNVYLPSFTFYKYGLSQQIYTADEIGTAGMITSVAFFNEPDEDGDNTKTRSYGIYLKPTNKFEFYNSKDWVSVTEDDKVFSGEVTMTSDKWTIISFEKPFVYDGTSNLVLVMDDNSGNYESSHYMTCRVYNTGLNQAIYTYADQTNYNPTQPSAYSGTIKDEKNQVYFGFTSSIDCWTPAFLTTTGITSYSATLDWNGYQDSYNLRYRIAPPFYEDFEDEETFATDWTFISMNTENSIGAGRAGRLGVAAHSGGYGFRFSSYYTADDYNQYLVSSQLTTTGELKFFYEQYTENVTEIFEVGYSTTTNDLSAFTWSNVELSTDWQEYTLQLSSDVKYIAFHYYGDYAFYIFLDDITIGDNGIPIGEWINVNNISGTTTEIIDLEPKTNYLWQVRGNNTSCNENGHTQWSKKSSFTTRCGAIYVDAGNPFFEDFEGTTFVPDCWETFSTSSNEWSKNTSSSFVHSGSASAYSHYYGNNYLVLPDIELPADAPAAQLTFWSFNYYTSYFIAGNNTVVLLNGDNETVLWSAETVSAEWVETTVDLTAYLGQTITLAFKYAGYNANDWYVDDVEVSVTSSIFLNGGDWYLIASPIPSTNPANVPGMTSGNYDLYRFEPSATDEEWQNYKGTPFSLQSGKGYLYSHGTDITLVFDGEAYEGNGMVQLSYDANDDHKCWNLVGNPFNCEATLDRDYYVLNDEGTGINPVAVPASTPIPACTAVFVKAIAAVDTVVFTKVTP